MNHLLDDFCIVSDHIRGMIIRAATCLQACIIVTPLRASSVRPSRQAILLQPSLTMHLCRHAVFFLFEKMMPNTQGRASISTCMFVNLSFDCPPRCASLCGGLAVAAVKRTRARKWIICLRRYFRLDLTQSCKTRNSSCTAARAPVQRNRGRLRQSAEPVVLWLKVAMQRARSPFFF